MLGIFVRHIILGLCVAYFSKSMNECVRHINLCPIYYLELRHWMLRVKQVGSTFLCVNECVIECP